MAAITEERSIDEILNQEVVAPGTGSFDLHDEDTWIPGTLLKPEVAPSNRDGWAPQLKWFWLDDNEAGQGSGKDGADRTEWYFTPTIVTTSEKNKLRALVKFLTGEFPSEGQKPDLRPFVNSRVDVMFERYQSTDKDGNKVTRERIYKMRPSSTPAPSTAL